MNIFEKMAAISEEVGYVPKSLSVGFGNNTYKASGEGDVLAAVKPLEAKYKVYSYPASRTIIDSGEVVSKSNAGEKRQMFMRVETVYRFVNLEDPKDYIEIVSYGDGIDTQDKAPGKAMTYSDKYALLKAYKIQTGDDPDQDYSLPLQGKSNGTKGSMKITAEQVSEIERRLERMTPPGKVGVICKQYGVSTLSELTIANYEHLDARLKRAES